MVEPRETGAWRLEVQLRDPHTKAELTTGKPKVDPYRGSIHTYAKTKEHAAIKLAAVLNKVSLALRSLSLKFSSEKFAC